MNRRLLAPWALVLRLVVIATAILAAGALVTLALGYLALPVLAHERPAAAQAVVACTVGGWAILILTASFSMRRLPAMHRRLELRMQQAAPPPPDEEVRVLFQMPRRATVAGALGLLPGTFVAAGSNIELRGAVAVAVLCLGVQQGAMFLVGLLWRLQLWNLLQRVEAADVHLETAPTLALRFALRITSAGLVVPAAGLAMALCHVAGAAWIVVAWVAAAAAAILLFAGGMRLGQWVAADVHELTESVRELVQTAGWSSGEYSLPAHLQLRTNVANDIAKSVDALAGKYAAMASAESEARNRIEATQRLKTRFMALMSHDLRSPLNSITGFADILSQGLDGPLNADQRESVESIRTSGAELLRLVTDIIDSARIDAGRLQLNLVELSCLPLMEEAVAQARDVTQGVGVEYALETAGDLPPVHVDHERFLQALTGVLFHVVRMVRAGTIQLSARAVEHGALLAGPYVQIDVGAADLPEEDSQRIFLAFREIRRPSGGRVGGLGLGLHLAHSLIEAHGGALVYETLEGARFTFAMPLQPRLTLQ